MFWVVPAHKRLGTCKNRGCRTNVKLRLIVYLKLLLGNGCREIFNQLLGIDFPVVHIFIIDTDWVREAALHRIRSHLCPVEASFYFNPLVNIGIDA